jgi:hypothetical protein
VNFWPRTRELEAQIEELKAEKAELLRIIDRFADKNTVKTAQEIVESRKKHEITITSTGARCACGQIFSGGDPARLQEAISGHITVNLNKILHGGRKSWPEIKAKAEQSALQEDPA